MASDAGLDECYCGKPWCPGYKGHPDPVPSTYTELLSGVAMRGGETVHAMPAGSKRPGTKALCGSLADPINEPFDAASPYACKNCLRTIVPRPAASSRVPHAAASRPPQLTESKTMTSEVPPASTGDAAGLGSHGGGSRAAAPDNVDDLTPDDYLTHQGLRQQIEQYRLVTDELERRLSDAESRSERHAENAAQAVLDCEKESTCIRALRAAAIDLLARRNLDGSLTLGRMDIALVALRKALQETDR